MVNNGCPYDVDAIAREAIDRELTQVLKWALDHGAQVEAERAIDIAARSADLVYLRILTSLVFFDLLCVLLGPHERADGAWHAANAGLLRTRTLYFDFSLHVAR